VTGGPGIVTPAASPADGKQAQARLRVSRHACELFWERGVAATTGDDIAAAAGLSTRTIWRYFRTKESCVEPVLALSAQALRTAYLMVHDEMERGFIPVVARRLRLPDEDLTVRLCAAAVTAAFRVVDEDVGRRAIIDRERVTQQEALALIDRAIRDATNGRLGGPVKP
jgi:AcrR family transcriptional regulator